MSGWTAPGLAFAVDERSQPSQPQADGAAACLRSRVATAAGKASFSSDKAMARRADAGIRVHVA